jgi:hypothetical protein
MLPGSRVARFLMTLVAIVVIVGLVMQTCAVPVAA